MLFAAFHPIEVSANNCDNQPWYLKRSCEQKNFVRRRNEYFRYLNRSEDNFIFCDYYSQGVAVKIKVKLPDQTCYKASSYWLERQRLNVNNRLNIPGFFQSIWGDLLNLIGNIANTFNELFSIIYFFNRPANLVDLLGAIFNLAVSIIIFVVTLVILVILLFLLCSVFFYARGWFKKQE
ncbi:hypothetical protein [Cuspidothrix issatschenkoi]|uniref:Uncharacterized protein n=1 Tax=Cuspidothrix issatschenkoi CHARLIE-1 TaxID=2052836 RepID=A0A2S6CTG2_9CYAN|nr:hypothetical protein [Cuspidothrix issatschenkoi]PPJ62987.1 hypothetical protein CUN59_12590 [Cuspidothrix issatschenkoi CHARLIE-1]